MQKITTLGEAGYECIAKTDTARTWRRTGSGWKKFIHFRKEDGHWYAFGTFSEYVEEEGGWFSKTLRMSVDEANAIAYTLRCLERDDKPVLD